MHSYQETVLFQFQGCSLVLSSRQRSVEHILLSADLDILFHLAESMENRNGSSNGTVESVEESVLLALAVVV
jgi:hypothetical protein